jgi:hypothetical protein
MNLYIVKAVAGTQWFVMDNDIVLESFDDEMKAKRFVEELRKTDNDRLLTLQKEAIQTAERSNDVDEKREAEVRRDATRKD